MGALNCLPKNDEEISENKVGEPGETTTVTASGSQKIFEKEKEEYEKKIKDLSNQLEETKQQLGEQNQKVKELEHDVEKHNQAEKKLQAEIEDSVATIYEMNKKHDESFALQDTMKKFARNGKGKPKAKSVWFLTPTKSKDCYIQYSEEVGSSKVAVEKIKSISKDPNSFPTKLSEEEEKLLLCFQTDKRPLYLLASTAEIREEWYDKIQGQFD